MEFKIPLRNNKKLKTLVDRINGDQELFQIWKCANVNAMDRSGISDHGEVHIRIVANAALRIILLLIKGDHHERYSLFIAFRKARELLDGIYDEPDLTTMVSETLHAIVAHDAHERCLTIEAGTLKVADATDMTVGRSRIPFEAGKVNIHSVSAQAVDGVNIIKGEKKPVCIEIKLANSAGIFQVDELLRNKLKYSPLIPYVEVTARIEGETERSLFDSYSI